MRKVRASYGMMAVTLLAIAALLLTPCLTMSSLPTESPAKVRLAEVTVGKVEQLLAAEGRVRYAAEWAAVSPAAGIVRQVYVSPGDSVTAGQALFRLDATQEETAMSALLRTEAQGTTVAEALPEAVWASGVDASAVETLVRQTAQQQSTTAAQMALRIVRADADGIVNTVEVSQHGTVVAGMPAVTLLGNGQELRCALVARDAEHVQVGQRARVVKSGVTVCMATVQEIGALRTDTLHGQTVADVTLLPDEELSLPLGASVEIEVILCSRNQVSTLPLTAVTEQGTAWWVSGGRCYEIPVTVDARDETVCQVDLPAGVRVVDDPGKLLEGQRIKEMKP